MASNLTNLNIGIVGCGWLGVRMAKKWQIRNRVYTTTTSKDKIKVLASQNLKPTLVNFNADRSSVGFSLWEAIPSLDVLIITFPISTRKDHDIYNIQRRIDNFSTFIGSFGRQMFFINSTSVYPNKQKEFTEEDVPVEKVFAEHLLRTLYPQVNILRLGGLMGDDRQLSKYNIPNLDAPVNHVHFKDVTAVIEKMIENKSRAKLYNVVAPEHPTKREVIAIQKNQHDVESEKEIGRLISSNRLINELEYDFIYSDPKYFHH